MTGSEPLRQSGRHQGLKAAIFDVDGVLIASPHECAWREALEGFADPAHFTSEIYEEQVAGKPRLAGALAALDALGVAEAGRQATAYADRKQKGFEELIHAGRASPRFQTHCVSFRRWPPWVGLWRSHRRRKMLAE